MFPALSEVTWKQVLAKNDNPITDLPYVLRIKNLTGYMESCYFCGDKRCESGCPLPYTDELTYGDLLQKIGQQSNDSYFGDHYNRGKKDINLDAVWCQSLTKEFFSQFLHAQSFLKKLEKDGGASSEETKSASQDTASGEGVVTLQDCLLEFENPEMLD